MKLVYSRGGAPFQHETSRFRFWLGSILIVTGLSGCSPVTVASGTGAAVAALGCAGAMGRAPIPCVAEPVDTTPIGAIPTASVDAAKARADVMPTIASATPDFVEKVAPKGMPNVNADPPIKTPHGVVASLSLDDAVATAVLSHPTMGAAAAKVLRAQADTEGAKAAFRPTLSISGGSGWATLGQYENYPVVFHAPNLPGTSRTDIGLTFRQLIYDFGAAEHEVERNKALVDSETLKLSDQAEDIALRTVNAYLNVLEQQELLDLIDSTIVNERKLAGLVKLSQQNGNSAVSDVDRVNSKILEIEATRTDISSAHNIALDEFRRLTNLEPRQVRRPRLEADAIPKTADLAIKEAKGQNPAVLAIRATAVSLQHQLDGEKAAAMPRIDLQADSLVKHYYGVSSASVGVIDNRAMIMMSYKILDGGLHSAQLDRIRASQNENDYSELDQIETLELNIRRFYETLAADRAKRESAERGVATANKVNAAYTEQFKAGKRTIFEVLDSFTSIFAMKKNRINGEYEALRSQYGVLRNLGRLNKTLMKSA